jgi:type IX secretion system PorP/SprF family membrane protein
MKKLNYIAVGIMIIVFSETVNAQDVHFSQYLQTPLLINPALTGMIDANHRILLNYRSQWTSVGAPYKTIAFSYDTHILQNRSSNGSYMGLGLTVFKDKAGDSHLTQTQVNISASGVIKVNDNNTVSLGIQGGYAQRAIILDNLKWGNQYDGNQYDANLPSNEVSGFNNYAFADASAGAVWQYRKDEHSFASGTSFSKIEAGIAVYHLTTPAQKYYDMEEVLNRKFVLHASMEMNVKDSHVAIVPSVVYMQQGVLNELLFGSMIKYKMQQRTSKYTGIGKDASVYFGLQMRMKDAIIPMFIYEMESYAIGISYDFNSSGLKKASSGRGGYEVMLRFMLGRDRS